MRSPILKMRSFGNRKLGGMPGATISRMRDIPRVERRHVRVILDVERDGVPIRGSLLTPAGVQRRFHGWLELADAVETARAATGPSAPVATDLPPAVARIS
jgi:hypothetical protein